MRFSVTGFCLALLLLEVAAAPVEELSVTQAKGDPTEIIFHGETKTAVEDDSKKAQHDTFTKSDALVRNPENPVSSGSQVISSRKVIKTAENGQDYEYEYLYYYDDGEKDVTGEFKDDLFLDFGVQQKSEPKDLQSISEAVTDSVQTAFSEMSQTDVHIVKQAVKEGERQGQDETILATPAATTTALPTTPLRKLSEPEGKVETDLKKTRPASNSNRVRSKSPSASRTNVEKETETVSTTKSPTSRGRNRFARPTTESATDIQKPQEKVQSTKSTQSRRKNTGSPKSEVSVAEQERSIRRRNEKKTNSRINPNREENLRKEETDSNVANDQPKTGHTIQASTDIPKNPAAGTNLKTSFNWDIPEEVKAEEEEIEKALLRHTITSEHDDQLNTEVAKETDIAEDAKDSTHTILKDTLSAGVTEITPPSSKVVPTEEEITIFIENPELHSPLDVQVQDLAQPSTQPAQRDLSEQTTEVPNFTEIPSREDEQSTMNAAGSSTETAVSDSIHDAPQTEKIEVTIPAKGDTPQENAPSQELKREHLNIVELIPAKPLEDQKAPAEETTTKTDSRRSKLNRNRTNNSEGSSTRSNSRNKLNKAGAAEEVTTTTTTTTTTTRAPASKSILNGRTRLVSSRFAAFSAKQSNKLDEVAVDSVTGATTAATTTATASPGIAATRRPFPLPSLRRTSTTTESVKLEPSTVSTTVETPSSTVSSSARGRQRFSVNRGIQVVDPQALAKSTTQSPVVVSTEAAAETKEVNDNVAQKPVKGIATANRARPNILLKSRTTTAAPVEIIEQADNEAINLEVADEKKEVVQPKKEETRPKKPLKSISFEPSTEVPAVTTSSISRLNLLRNRPALVVSERPKTTRTEVDVAGRKNRLSSFLKKPVNQTEEEKPETEVAVQDDSSDKVMKEKPVEAAVQIITSDIKSDAQPEEIKTSSLVQNRLRGGRRPGQITTRRKEAEVQATN